MARTGNPLPIPQLECPLGDEHCMMLNEALKSCSDTRCYLEKLAAIGLDVSGWANENSSNETLAKALKEIHFPHSP